MSGDIGESHGGTEGYSAGWIIAAHDARHVGADRIEAGDWLTLAAEHAGVGVRAQAGEGPEAPGYDLDRVEWRAIDRARSLAAMTWRRQ